MSMDFNTFCVQVLRETKASIDPSSAVAVIKAVWSLGNNPNLRVMTLSSNWRYARYLTDSFVALAECSQVVHQTFPDLRVECRFSSGDVFLVRDRIFADRSLLGAYPSCGTLGCRGDMLILDGTMDEPLAHPSAEREALIKWAQASLFTRLTRNSQIADGFSTMNTQTLFELVRAPGLQYPEGAVGPQLLQLIKALRQS